MNNRTHVHGANIFWPLHLHLITGGKTRTALDIGANIGHHTQLYAGVFQHVHAFEPIESICTSSLYTRFNGLEHVSIHNHALGSANETRKFYQGLFKDTGWSSFNPVKAHDVKHKTSYSQYSPIG